VPALAALHSNGTKLVLVEKLDRLARDLMIQESITACAHTKDHSTGYSNEPPVRTPEMIRSRCRLRFRSRFCERILSVCLWRHCILLSVTALFIACGMAQEQAAESQGSGSSSSSKPETPNIWNRPQLTGDWGGARTAMSKHGIDWQIELTQFYQGKAAGSGNASSGYSGVADVFLTLDSEKLHLWKGGSFTLHPQFGYCDKSLNPGGVLFVTNTAMMMPIKSGQTAVLTNLFLKQKFGDRYTLTIGKINTIAISKQL
jgi:carbohydrate-selective porin OprB